MTTEQTLEAIKNGYELTEHFIQQGSDLIGTRKWASVTPASWLCWFTLPGAGPKW